MAGGLFGGSKAFEEGFATGFAWGEHIAYGTIRLVLSERLQHFDEGGHTPACECKPCELIREVLEDGRVS